ncbi:hypothetical protein ACFX2H_031919 [Malus domestica]
MARLLKCAFRSMVDGYPERVASTGMPKGEVPQITMISRIVGPMGPRGRTIVLVAEHHRLEATIRSSLSTTSSIDERRMTS